MKNLTTILGILAIVSCTMQKQAEKNPLALNEFRFDTVIDGKPVKLYTLKNEKGITVYLTNYGARIVGVQTPDKDGNYADIALGYGDIHKYVKDKMYTGCIVGRYANRIKDAHFTLDGKGYDLYKNDGDNTLHGGKEGLNKKVWDAVQNGNTLTMTYFSPDGEEGYPGNLNITNTFTLNRDNTLSIKYEAVTDKPTVINLSNHAYWNLKGEGDSTILDHYFQINADSFTPVDNEWIPTGEIAPVEGTPFDFREGKMIGADINMENEQLANGKGYDHNWVLNKESGDKLSFAAKLWEPSNGRYIKIFTSEPGFQFYSGNFLDGTVKGRSGRPYEYRSALVFETQHFPDSPNHSNFPSTVLRPGETYKHSTLYEFGVMQ